MNKWNKETWADYKFEVLRCTICNSVHPPYVVKLPERGTNLHETVFECFDCGSIKTFKIFSTGFSYKVKIPDSDGHEYLYVFSAPQPSCNSHVKP